MTVLEAWTWNLSHYLFMTSIRRLTMLKREKFGSEREQSESTNMITTYSYPCSWMDVILSFPCLCSVHHKLHLLFKLPAFLVPAWHWSAQMWIHYPNAECKILGNHNESSELCWHHISNSKLASQYSSLFTKTCEGCCNQWWEGGALVFSNFNQPRL